MGIGSEVEYRFPENQFWCEYRYSRESVPAWIPFPRKSASTWTPIFQGKKSALTWTPIFQGIWLQRECRYSKEIGSNVDTVSQKFSSGMDTDHIPGNWFQREYRYSRFSLDFR
ncbi:unnamed protein product [Rhizophagus irregularis]|nr:unnamed protein product [Rhizophagus irregularis]